MKEHRDDTVNILVILRQLRLSIPITQEHELNPIGGTVVMPWQDRARKPTTWILVWTGRAL